MKVRKLHKLYPLLIEVTKSFDPVWLFICNRIDGLWQDGIISKKEYKLLKKHFESQKPSESLHSEFLKSKLWKGDGCWWQTPSDLDTCIKSKRQRLRFLRKLLKETKKQNI